MHRHVALLAQCSLLSLLAFGQTAHAQSEAPLREGFFFSVGAGASSVSASCDGCTNDFFEDRITGFSGNLMIGGAVNPRLTIAGEFSGWLGNDPPIYRRVASLSLVVISYPSASHRFFVKSAVGGVRAIGENDVLLVQTDAFRGQVGVGYDFPMGQQALTAYFNYAWSFAGRTWVNGFESSTVVLPNSLQAGLAFTVF